MDVTSIDPRDISQHADVRAWRVYFYEEGGPGRGLVSDEYRITGESDVKAVLAWSDERADGRRVVCYAEIATGSEPALVLLSGDEPD